MRRFSIVLVLVSLLQVGSAARGQSPAPDKQQSTSTFTTHATAILVDVVVRDKKGGLVTDLSQSDFDVAEDGVHQKIGSFAVVNHGGGIGIGIKFRQPGGTTVLSPTDPAGADSAPAAPVEPAMTALIFDALSPEALSITQKAALGYVPMVGESEARIGVFGTEPALKILQAYTSDLALVRKGIRDVTATVESVPLITASILSKKLAAGLGFLVMDVKTGSGAFMAKLEDSRELARSIVDVANGAGLKTSALITDMNHALGTTVGNGLCVWRSLLLSPAP